MNLTGRRGRQFPKDSENLQLDFGRLRGCCTRHVYFQLIDIWRILSLNPTKFSERIRYVKNSRKIPGRRPSDAVRAIRVRQLIRHRFSDIRRRRSDCGSERAQNVAETTFVCRHSSPQSRSTDRSSSYSVSNRMSSKKPRLSVENWLLGNAVAGRPRAVQHHRDFVRSSSIATAGAEQPDN